MFASRYEFFNELYHRFLLTPKVAMKCLCLQALTIVYGKCCEEIGPFTDTKYIVGMLDRVSVFTYCNTKMLCFIALCHFQYSLNVLKLHTYLTKNGLKINLA